MSCQVGYKTVETECDFTVSMTSVSRTEARWTSTCEKVKLKALNETVLNKAVSLVTAWQPPTINCEYPAYSRRVESSAILRCNVFDRRDDGRHVYNSAIVWIEASDKVIEMIKTVIEAYDPDVSGSFPAP